MHNNDSSQPTTSHEKELADLDAAFWETAKSLEESMKVSATDMKLWAPQDCDMELMSDIDMDGIFDGKALDLDMTLFSDTTLIRPGGGRLPPGNVPNLSTFAPCEPSGTQHISIRIPVEMLAAFRQEASRRGIKYQRLVIESLRIILDQWRRASLNPGTQVQ